MTTSTTAQGQTAGALEVHHFGPCVDEVGGIASVIRTFAEHTLGADHVIIHATWSSTSRWRTLKFFLFALVSLSRIRSDALVHVHLSERGSFLREGAILRLARARGLGTVATLHGAEFDAFAARRNKLVAAVLRSADAITCLAESQVPAVAQMAPKSRVAYIPNPVAIQPRLSSAADTEPLILFAGEVSERKGADVLHAAWPAIQAAVPQARCVLVGPPTSLSLSSQAGFEVLGPAPSSAVQEMIRQARCIALPSRAEALPMILLEAMAASRPFISTPVGGIQALEDGGMLVPVGDRGALAAAAITLLSQPDEASRLGAAGLRSIESTRSIEAVADALRSVYGATARRQHHDTQGA